MADSETLSKGSRIGWNPFKGIENRSNNSLTHTQGSQARYSHVSNKFLWTNSVLRLSARILKEKATSYMHKSSPLVWFCCEPGGQLC
jgi:hypothetical protein